MNSLHSTLQSLDGVAQKRELQDAGITVRELRSAADNARIFRVRQGWYALPDADRELVRAVRIGGRLACVSAARRFGWAVSRGTDLHVALKENASRLRAPDHGGIDHGQLYLHWDSPLPRWERPRLVTSVRETVHHLAVCQSPELAVAAFDSVLHGNPEIEPELEAWIQELPRHARLALPQRSAQCESFLESIGRIRLAREGIVGRHQVPVPGVGRVDLMIGDLVIEWDGSEHHDNGPAHDLDTWRDAELTRRGYRVLRFSYNLVMSHWNLVLSAIRSALSGLAIA